MAKVMDVELTIQMADIVETLLYLEKEPGQTDCWPIKARLIIPLDASAEPLNGGAAMAERAALEKRLLDEALAASQRGTDPAQAAADGLVYEQMIESALGREPDFGVSLDDTDDEFRPSRRGRLDDDDDSDDDFDDDDDDDMTIDRPRYRAESLPVEFRFPDGLYRVTLDYPFENPQRIERRFDGPTATTLAQWIAWEYYLAYERNESWESEHPEPPDQQDKPWNLMNRKPTHVPDGTNVPEDVPLVWGHVFEDLVLEGFTLNEDEDGTISVDPAIGS